jgi:hypothetical protein
VHNPASTRQDDFVGLLCLVLGAKVVVEVVTDEGSAKEPRGVVDCIEVRSVADLVSRDPTEIDVAVVTPPEEPTDSFINLLDALKPRLRGAAILVSASRPPWYVAYVREPASGFRTSLSARGALSLWVGTA